MGAFILALLSNLFIGGQPAFEGHADAFIRTQSIPVISGNIQLSDTWLEQGDEDESPETRRLFSGSFDIFNQSALAAGSREGRTLFSVSALFLFKPIFLFNCVWRC